MPAVRSPTRTARPSSPPFCTCRSSDKARRLSLSSAATAGRADSGSILGTPSPACGCDSPSTLAGSPPPRGPWDFCPGFPPALLEHCIETMLFCLYGQCQHPSCLGSLPPLLLPSPSARTSHAARAAAEAPRLRAYVARLLLLLPLRPAHLARAAGYVRRLRRTLDRTQPDDRASRFWGAHHLVLLVSLVLARKFCEDGPGPRAREWGAAGGFRKDVVVKAEREMLGMLGWNLA